ncbi:MAG: iron-containing alcohol dehydrogenase [Pirellulales bacterium]|nr:iron-containing alcohol dehydrogenase [Pirellulales bacterium]
MSRPWAFFLPTQIEFGPKRLRKVGRVAAAWGQTALVVGYKDSPPLEAAYAAATESLKAAGLAVVPFLEIVPEPDAETVTAGAQQAVEAGADVVVAVGGGSVLDAAKAIALLAIGRDTLWDCTKTNPQSYPAAEALSVVAVPTTAGTGAEVTSLSIIIQRGVGALPDAPVKTIVYGPALAPRVALVDPDLTLSCPARLTAGCGADALGHAIEACLSRRANPLATALGHEAVALVVGHLGRAVSSPDDGEARHALSLAAVLGGMALESAGVTVTHALAHAVGALLHVPHGEAVAMATPVNLRYNAPACAEQYARLADVCGLGGATPAEQADRFVARIVDLLASVGLPDRAFVPHESASVLAPRLAQNAIDGTTPSLHDNPRPIERAQLEDLFGELLAK